MQPALDTAVPIVTAVAQPAQMQVTVPAGIGPGMMFMVNTPAGQMMQITCPDGVTAGGQVMVAVPMVAVPMVNSEADQELVEMMRRGGIFHTDKPVAVGPARFDVEWNSQGTTVSGLVNVKLCCCCCPIATVTFTNQFSPDFKSYTSTTSEGFTETGTLVSFDAANKVATYSFNGLQKAGPSSGTLIYDGRAQTVTVTKTAPNVVQFTMTKTS